MSQMELLMAVLAAACGACAVLGVLWGIRDRADRAAVARLDAVAIDPYHAVATAGRDYDRDPDRAGAAELLAAGLIRIEEDGRVAVTVEGADPGRTPEHPVPAAVLATLRGHAQPWPLNWLYMDTEHCRRRDPFLRAEDAKWPRWSERIVDRVKPAVMLVAVLLAGWCAAQLLYAADAFSGRGGEIAGAVFLALLIWGVFALVLWLVVVCVWPSRRDRFAEYCRGLPPHPAEDALDAGQREQLHRAMTYDPPKVEAETWTDTDTPGAF